MRNITFLFLIFFATTGQAENYLADPTQPPSYAAEISRPHSPSSELNTQPQWIVSSILITPKDKIAIINGKQLHPGDDIDGATIIDIDYQQVILLYKKKKIKLTLRHSFIQELHPQQP